MTQLVLNYSPGPKDKVLRAFMRSDARIRAIMGPQGSAKTTCCLMQIPVKAIKQVPSPIDGIRRTRFACIRDTYRNLERTTIDAWHRNIPKEFGEWRGGASGEPAKHFIDMNMADGSKVRLEVWFVAIGDNDVEDVFRGWEFTAFYLNEADLLPPDVFRFARGRMGRYPSMQHGGPTWFGGMLDFNAPNYDHEFYEMFVKNPPEGWEFFEQPGGLEPDAENTHNLTDDYYEEMMKGQPEWWIRRMVHNKWGFSREGKPVYPEFTHQIHVAKKKIEPIHGIEIEIGADAGRSPSASFQQKDPEGQIRILDEMPCFDIGAKEFGRRLASYTAERFPGMNFKGTCDPAAAYPDQTTDNDDDLWVSIVSQESEIKFKAAPTNKSLARKEALRQPMMLLIREGKPGLTVSPNCNWHIDGFNFGYRFRRMKLAGVDRYDDTPEKNKWSHTIEAAEYGALKLTGYHEIQGRKRSRRQERGRQVANTNFRPKF